jgi:predicted proteasome-type protease
MNIYFDNGVNGEKLTYNKKLTYEEVLELLQRLSAPNGTLIMQLSSGLGIDFVMLEKDLLEVEFYTVDPSDASNASITTEVARQIIKRAFEGRSGKIKDIYSDLISEWNY